MKVTVTNLTGWNTRDLKRLLTEAARRVHVRLSKRVVIRVAKGGRIHGRAFIGNRRDEALNATKTGHWGGTRAALHHRNRVHHVCIYIPEEPFDAERFAAVAEHEFLHNLGARHRDMTEEQRTCNQDTPYARGFCLWRADGSLQFRQPQRKGMNMNKLAAQAEDALEDLKEATDTDTTAEEALTNLCTSVEAYFEAVKAKKDVSKEMKEHIEQTWQALKTNIEESTTSGKKDELVGKLRRIELAYQEYEDAVAYAKEGKKAAKEEVDAAKEQLKRAVTESKQLTLPGV